MLELTLSGALESDLGPTLRFGGLRAGWAEFAERTRSAARLLLRPRHDDLRHDRQRSVDLQVGGSSAAHGSLHRGANKSLVGTLAGTHVALSGSYLASAIATAAIVGADAQESSNSGSDSSAARSSARRLDRLLGGIQP